MIGDQVVAMPAGAESASLVVDLDANGVFGSAVAIANTTIAFAHATSGEMIIAGVYQGSALGLPEANDQDAFVAIASAGEVGRAYALGGPGAQELTGLARSNDGVIWLAMRNDYSLETDRSEAPSFRIGSRSFDGPDAFVLGFVY